MKTILLSFLMFGATTTAFAGVLSMGESTLIFETGNGLKLEMTVSQDKELILEQTINPSGSQPGVTRTDPDFARLWPVIQSMLKPEQEEKVPFELN